MRSLFVDELSDTFNSIKILTVAQNAFMAFFFVASKNETYVRLHVKHTLRMCNSNCFSIATMVARTHLNYAIRKLPVLFDFKIYVYLEMTIAAKNCKKASASFTRNEHQYTYENITFQEACFGDSKLYMCSVIFNPLAPEFSLKF